ncbi:hypothetical protein KAJ89_02685 [Candidatus Parcubacteria bacterium]|nr:hypothetical protein [Candidatus Parcubacteria bacterium]
MNNNGLFKNKYRIKSARLVGYDYSGDGLYFITICTHNKEMFFGNVKNGKMILNDIGKLAKNIGRKFRNIFHLLNWTNIL